MNRTIAWTRVLPAPTPGHGVESIVEMAQVAP